MKYTVTSRLFERNIIYEIGDEIETDEERGKELKNYLKITEKKETEEKKKKDR
ncbi:MAG: hypothetical protein IAE65_10275 [Ignavibacteria bacterium]|nr:hypothetical protein [Ignavibacteria bacterium]